MDMHTDNSPGLYDVVPYDQAALFVASQPRRGVDRDDVGEQNKSEISALQEYLAERLVKGPPEELGDRISLLLRDSRYWELNARLTFSVAFTALGDMMTEEEVPDFFRNHAELYTRALDLQLWVLHAHLAFASMPSSAKERPRKRRAQRPVERLAFMQSPMPSVLKRALLSMWVAPMCSVAVTAIGSDTPSAATFALLEEWKDSLERQLALFVAMGLVQLKDVSHILPLERQISLDAVCGNWMQGYGRTLVAMSDMASKRDIEEGESRSRE